jgi:hypothetical protein
MSEVAIELFGAWDHAAAQPVPHLIEKVVLPHDGNFQMRLQQHFMLSEWRLVWITPPPAGLEAENKRLRGELDAIEQECRSRLAADPSEAAAETARAILGHMGLSEGEEPDWDAAGYDV